MSAATEIPPVVFIPERARPRRERLQVVAGSRRAPTAFGASGTALLAPGPRKSILEPVLEPTLEPWSTPTLHARVDTAAITSTANVTSTESLCDTPLGAAAPLRLTARGTRALALLAFFAAVVVVLVAWLSADARSGSAAASASASTVTVHSGDTLWSVARSVAPNRDPRDEVDDLVRLNHLSSVAIQPGQILHTR